MLQLLSQHWLAIRGLSTPAYHGPPQVNIPEPWGFSEPSHLKKFGSTPCGEWSVLTSHGVSVGYRISGNTAHCPISRCSPDCYWHDQNATCMEILVKVTVTSEASGEKESMGGVIGEKNIVQYG